MSATSWVPPWVEAAQRPSAETAIRPAPLPRPGSIFTTSSFAESMTCTVPSPSLWIQTSPLGAKPTPTGPPAIGMIFVMVSVAVSITSTRWSSRIG